MMEIWERGDGTEPICGEKAGMQSCTYNMTILVIGSGQNAYHWAKKGTHGAFLYHIPFSW